jgi:hypothetical protein
MPLSCVLNELIRPQHSYKMSIIFYVLYLSVSSTALVGMFIAIIVNETCDTLPDGEKCASTVINFLKAMTSVTTGATIFFLLWQVSVSRRQSQTKAALSTRHIKYKPKSESQIPKRDNQTLPDRIRAWFGSVMWSDASKNLVVILTVALNCVHTVPGLTFAVKAEMLGMTVVYRIEALITVSFAASTRCCNHLTARDSRS